MNQKHGPFSLSKEMEEQRLLNLRTVEQFMTFAGPHRHEKRAPLFAEDSRFELPFAGPSPEESFSCNGRGRDRKQGWKAIFPDWGFYDSKILSTNDPCTVFVECDGRGMRYDPRYPEPHFYENHYILVFTLKDGQIKRMREIFNPFNVLRPSGEDVPELF